MVSTTIEVLENIEYIFDSANEYFYNNELEKPIFGLTETKDSYGHISVGNYWRSNGKGKRELNINPNYLDRSLKEVVTTILHEMAHLDNMTNEIKDCSGYYHNKKFKEAAEKIGLIVEKNENYGYCITKPSLKTEQFIEEYRIISFNASRIRFFNINLGKGEEEKKGKSEGEESEGEGKKIKKGNSIKYYCPTKGCKCIARTTKATNLICGDHNEKLITDNI